MCYLFDGGLAANIHVKSCHFYMSFEEKLSSLCADDDRANVSNQGLVALCYIVTIF